MITIHVSHPQRPDVTRQLVRLAGGDRSQVAAATAGVTVSDDLALAWLTALRPRLNAARRATPLAAEVRAAEQRVGIGDPDQAKERAAVKGRARKSTTAAAEEQQ